MSGGRSRSPGPGLFRDIVLAPDRESTPDSAPLVSFAEGDAPDYLGEVRRRAIRSYSLERRGVDHGGVAELRGEGIVGPRPRRKRREAMQSERWVSARPIFLPGAAETVRAAILGARVGELVERLREPEGLRAYLRKRAPQLGSELVISDEELELFDPERDVARVAVGDSWLKVGRLSTHAADASLRLRVSFGREGDDDASADEARQRSAGELGRLVLPGAEALDASPEWRAVVERHVGRAVYGSQQIAYWNAPGGGARFHHDAFGEDDTQLGVVYAQLTGRTVWLALSIEEMSLRVREFVGWIADGDLAWLREEMGETWATAVSRVAGRASCLAELGAPDCGVFDRLVNAPEFTRYLTDAGHAQALGPGDVLLLPNHGVDRTAMHSVFSGSEEIGYALSIALRATPG